MTREDYLRIIQGIRADLYPVGVSLNQDEQAGELTTREKLAWDALRAAAYRVSVKMAEESTWRAGRV